MALKPKQIAELYATWDLERARQPNDTATHYAVANRLRMGYATVRKYLACRAGHMPPAESALDPAGPPPETSGDYEMSAAAPAPQGFVAGESVLYDEHGNVKLHWVKTQNKLTDQWARETAKALAEDLPVLDPIVRTDTSPVREALVVIPFGDPHLGLHAWAEETGADYDLKIAERDLCEAVGHLVSASAPSSECLIANLGDFFHADNMDAETWRSKHRLDVDTRWAKVLRVGVKAMRQCIEAAAKRHGKVTVINAIGNHDDHTAIFLSICLSHLYEDNPRIEIIDSPTVKHYYRYRSNLIGVHHGHTIKMADLPFQMATDRPQDWAETEHRMWLTGHIHHDSRKEINGVIVESYRTLAARDAWAAGRGYISGRDMKAIVLDPHFGEVERHTVSVKRLAFNRRMANDAEVK